MASVFEFLGIGRQAIAVAIAYLALFAGLWLSEGLAMATFAAIVLLAFGLAVRVVAGVCGILDDARKRQFDRRNLAMTVLAGGALTVMVFIAELPMATIAKASFVVGVMVYSVAKFPFRT